MKDTGRHRPRARYRVAAIAVCAIFAAAPQSVAQSADTLALINRIERLQNELTTLQRYVYRGEKPPASQPAPAAVPTGSTGPNVAAHLQVRITQLEAEIQHLTGYNEELGHRLALIQTRLEKLSTDLAFRLSRLEQGAPAVAQPGGAMPREAPAEAAPAAAASVPPAPGPAATASVPPVPGEAMGVKPLGALRGGTPPPVRTAARPAPANETPQQQYDRAHSLIVKDQNFAEAERVLRDFIDRNAKHELLPNAHYWLGRTYFVRNDFEQAAFAFAEGFQRFPKSAKAPANLLNLGMALSRLGKNREACTTYARLLKGYPDAEDAVKRRVAREKSRAKCP